MEKCVITLNLELVEKVEEQCLNISKVCENALNQAINVLERIFDENKVSDLKKLWILDGGRGWI